MEYRRNYYLMPAEQSMQFGILRVLTRRKNQSIAQIANRLAASPDTISNAIFGRGSGARTIEPNLITSGLVNFIVSGTEKFHFSLNLSFTGFLWYLFSEKQDKINLEVFNRIRSLYDNFHFPLFIEHDSLEEVFFPIYYGDGTGSSSPMGEHLLAFYRSALLEKFFTYDPLHSYPPLGIFLNGREFMVEDHIVKSKSPEEVSHMIEEYNPKLLHPLLRYVYERKKVVLEPWSLHRHHRMTSIVNLEHDEMAKVEFAMLFLDNIPERGTIKNETKQYPVETAMEQREPLKSLDLMYELCGYIEGNLSNTYKPSANLLLFLMRYEIHERIFYIFI